MKIQLEIARTIRAFRQFEFKIPRGRVERDAWKFLNVLWSVVFGLVILSLVLLVRR